MSYANVPTSVRSLEQRIRHLEGNDGLALRRRVGMALVVVGQMLPEGRSRAAARWHCATDVEPGSPRISTRLESSLLLGSAAISRTP